MEKNEENPTNEVPKNESKEEDIKDFSQGSSISGFVNQEFVTQLTDFGFSKAVSEKSLYLTGGKSVESAMEWIEKHQQDPDYEEELRIVG